MSFHISIIASGRTDTPAASVGFNAVGLNGVHTAQPSKPNGDTPRDQTGLTLGKVLDTQVGGLTYDRR